MGSVIQREFRGGAHQTIVVYVPDDTGDEIDAVGVYGQIAEDARRRDARIVSMTALPLRHRGSLVSRTGSGYQTKLAVAVVFETG